MRLISQFLNQLSIISNHLLKKKSSNKDITNQKNSIFVELCPHINVQMTFHILLSSLLKRKFKIIFFYFGGYKLDILLGIFKFFLIKNNYQAINITRESKLKTKNIKFKNKTDFLNHEYKGYNISKYVYQSYCRLFYKTTLNLDDEKLYELINIAHARIDFLEGIFKKNKFKYLILTHTVFVDYGTIALVAKKFNCKIKIIFPDNNYSKIRILNIDNRYLLQIEKYYNYKNEFKKFKNKIDCLKKSQIELNNRIYKNITNPKVSNVAIYSKDNIVSFKSKKPKIIVLPSCFFDAQSFFRYSLFSDVHEWLDYTLYYASKTNFEWYVKPHPTNLKINNSIYKNFKKKYEKINFLNVNTSNLSFKKNNFSSMFTYQSSAVHEFAMMNIPSVVVGDNVSVNYRFGFPVKTIR